MRRNQSHHIFADSREMFDAYGVEFAETALAAFVREEWKHGIEHTTGSVETFAHPLDKYDIGAFAQDDPQRFMQLVQYLSPRDQEIMLLFAVLQKRPTDLSILFGKAGHRAEEDLHKAAHKLAGLAAFGAEPKIETLESLLHRNGLATFGASHSLAACVWQYARTRDFATVSSLVGQRGLRQSMLRAFKALHAAEGREEGLLAGWILWLVDGSDPKGKGWRKRRRGSRDRKLGPTVFRTHGPDMEQLQASRSATQRGGRAQRSKNVKITRRMRFVLRGMNV